jgi:hypothetical protein
MPFELELFRNKEGSNYVTLKSKRPYLQQRNEMIVHFRPLDSKERHLCVTYVGDVDVDVQMGDTK